MGWIIDFMIDFFWVGFVEHLSKGKPWWVQVLLALSPLILLALLFGVLYLAVEGWPA